MTALVAGLLPVTGAQATSTVDATTTVQSSGIAAGTYVAAKLTGHKLVVGSELRLEVEDSEGTAWMSASAGCNHASGELSVDAGKLQFPNGLEQTQMSCGDAADRQDEWILGFVSGATLVVRKRGFTLSNAGARARFAPALDPDAADAVVGQGWQLIEAQLPSGATRTVPSALRVKQSLYLSDRSGTFSTGCDGVGLTLAHRSGRAVISDRRVEPGLGRCPRRLKATRRAMLRALDGDVRLRRSGSRLTASGAGITLRFELRST